MIAKSDRPGPVLVDITKDVTCRHVTEYRYQEPVYVGPSVSEIREEDMEQAVQLIDAARKPFIFVGGGAVISGASEELSKVCPYAQCARDGFPDGQGRVFRNMMSCTPACWECTERRPPTWE